MSVRSLIVRALEALEDGDVDLAAGCLLEADAMLQRQEEGWIIISDVPTIPSPLEDAGGR